LSPDCRKAAAIAYAFAERYFRGLAGGVHAVDFQCATSLIAAMNIGRGSRTWEIGCGVPRLAAAVSAVSGTTVLCTDLPDKIAEMKNLIVQQLMKNRHVGNSFALFERLSPDACTDYIAHTHPFEKGQYPQQATLAEMQVPELRAWMQAHPVRTHEGDCEQADAAGATPPRRSKRARVFV
jgi:hypothetical protein